MSKLNFKYIYQNALDTFKVFETIPFEIYSVLIEGHSKTIWETLNHLILWREFQIQKLTKIKGKINFNESESWIAASKPINPKDWETKINKFRSQTEQILSLIENLDSSDLLLEEKLKLIQVRIYHFI